SLPTPMLLAHNWAKPIGYVIAVKRSSHRLEFMARLCDGFHWMPAVWDAVKNGEICAISVTGRKQSPHDDYGRWQLIEVSAAEEGLNPEAQILSVREIYRFDTVFFDSDQRG